MIDAQIGGLHLFNRHHKKMGPSCKNGKKPYLKRVMTSLSTLARFFLTYNFNYHVVELG
jgi:hypothetical protein